MLDGARLPNQSSPFAPAAGGHRASEQAHPGYGWIFESIQRRIVISSKNKDSFDVDGVHLVEIQEFQEVGIGGQGRAPAAAPARVFPSAFLLHENDASALTSK